MKKTFSLRVAKTIETMNRAEFGAYLAGLIEADGCFKRDALTIIFQLEDYALVKAICSRLGLDFEKHVQDRRSENPPCNAYRFIIYKDRTGNVVQLVNGKFVAPYKVQQLKKHNYARYLESNLILPASTKNFAGFWLSGFFDGDGSVSISITDKPGKRVILKCVINISQSTREVLELYGQQFKLNVHLKTRKVPNLNANPEYCVSTEGKEKLQLFFDYFELYPLQGVKRAQLLFLSNAFSLFKEKRHLSAVGKHQFYRWQRLIRRVTLESTCKQVYRLKHSSCLKPYEERKMKRKMKIKTEALLKSVED